jgi:hypothetical protein
LASEVNQRNLPPFGRIPSSAGEQKCKRIVWIQSAFPSLLFPASSLHGPRPIYVQPGTAFLFVAAVKRSLCWNSDCLCLVAKHCREWDAKVSGSPSRSCESSSISEGLGGSSKRIGLCVRNRSYYVIQPSLQALIDCQRRRRLVPAALGRWVGGEGERNPGGRGKAEELRGFLLEKWQPGPQSLGSFSRRLYLPLLHAAMYQGEGAFSTRRRGASITIRRF